MTGSPDTNLSNDFVFINLFLREPHSSVDDLQRVQLKMENRLLFAGTYTLLQYLTA